MAKQHMILFANKHKPYLPSLTSHGASPPNCWYILSLPTKGWPGWVDLGGWLYPEIIPIPAVEPSTNQNSLVDVTEATAAPSYHYVHLRVCTFSTAPLSTEWRTCWLASLASLVTSWLCRDRQRFQKVFEMFPNLEKFMLFKKIWDRFFLARPVYTAFAFAWRLVLSPPGKKTASSA